MNKLNSKTIHLPFRTEFPKGLWERIPGIASTAKRIPEATAKVRGSKRQSAWKNFLKDLPAMFGVLGLIAFIAKRRRRRPKNQD